MPSKEKTTSEEREQFLYAQQRIRQKRRLGQHFVLFLILSVVLLLANLAFDVGIDFFIPNWSVWVVLAWAILLLIHTFNVFFTNKFMGKEWEDKQLEKLREKQRNRVAELEKRVERESASPIVDRKKEIEEDDNKGYSPMPPEVK